MVVQNDSLHWFCKFCCPPAHCTVRGLEVHENVCAAEEFAAGITLFTHLLTVNFLIIYSIEKAWEIFTWVLSTVDRTEGWKDLEVFLVGNVCCCYWRKNACMGKTTLWLVLFSVNILSRTYLPPWLLYHTAYLFHFICLSTEFMQVYNFSKWNYVERGLRCKHSEIAQVWRDWHRRFPCVGLWRNIMELCEIRQSHQSKFVTFIFQLQVCCKDITRVNHYTLSFTF